MRNSINVRILIIFCTAVAILFAACKPFGGDFEDWREAAREKNGPYTVTFNPNGGTPAPKARDIDKGGKVTAPVINKTGYTVDGWYREAAFTKPWDFNKDTVTKDITLYAKWNPITYTVVYNKNADEATGTMGNSTHTYDVDRNLNGNAFDRPGYAFAGWARTPTGTVEFTNWQNVKNLTAAAGATETLYAVWSDQAYTVQYNANGGNGSMETSSLLIGGIAEYLRTNEFIRPGYTFAGWARTQYEAQNGTVEFTDGQSVSDLTQTVGATVTLYAVWKYAVTFDANGGSGTVPDTELVTPGSDIILPDESGLTRTGYTFGGWNTQANGGGNTYNAGESYTPASNITLYAKWNPITYTVTYDKNAANATGTMEDSSHTYDVTKDLNANTFTRYGYTFGGWATTVSGLVGYADGASVSNLTSTAGATVTLYAQWAAITQTVPTNGIVYYWVDEHESLVTTGNGFVIVSPDEALTITAQDAGYTVRQWRLNGINTGHNGSTFSFSSTATGRYIVGLFVEKGGKFYNTNITITVGGFYTVTFSANSGSGTAPNPQRVQQGSSIILPGGSGLTRSGYTFGGWNPDSSGSGYTYNVGESYTPYGDITLYARWLPNYNVTFSANNATSGTAPAAQSVSPGSSITLPDQGSLERSGYTFGGWNTQANGGGNTYNAGESYTPYGDITLYARWLTNYTVTFSANGATSGTAPTAQTVAYGFSITLPDQGSLTRNGYMFDGWNTSSYGGGYQYNAGESYTHTENYNVTLYAQWISIYTVTFSANGGSGTAPEAQTATYGISITLPAQGSLARSGYTFGGWNTNYSGTGTNYNAGESYMVTGTVTLYAQWNIGAPTGVSATATSSNSITVSWNSVSDAYYYYIYRSTSAYGDYSYVGDTYSASYTDYGLFAGTTYYYKVSVYSYNYGESDMSNYASATTFSSNASTPTGVSATATSSNNITVSWNSVSDAYYYCIYRSTSAYGDYFQVGYLDSTSYTDSGLYAGTTYYYKVSAINYNYEESALSSYAYATTFSGGPNPGGNGTESNPIPLTANYYNYDSITSTAYDSAVWYSFYVTGGNTYYVYWNDTDNGGGTLDVRVAAYYSNGEYLFDEDNAGSNSALFTAYQSGTVKLKVYPLNPGNTGNFAVTYNTSGTRP